MMQTKRGRKKGSTSFAKVSMEQLNEMFGKKAQIYVSKKQLEAMGYDCSKFESGRYGETTPTGRGPGRPRKEQTSEEAEEQVSPVVGVNEFD